MDDDETTFHVEQSDNESKVHEAEEQTLDATENDESITLVSNDHIRVKVRKSYLKNSGLLQTILETDKTVEEVKLASLDGESLGYVMQYILHHKGEDTKEIEKPIKSKFMKDNVQYPWDATFLEPIMANRDLQYRMLMAANYLDMNVFLKLLCSSVAALIKGKPWEEAKEILRINHGPQSKKPAVELEQKSNCRALEQHATSHPDSERKQEAATESKTNNLHNDSVTTTTEIEQDI